ncbi:MAG TPA: hypothetical protein VL332_12065 [Candidatus Saccharimonadaceae bacterium]|jgi:hypothetical protein|nr:hypothetical protein [Candidatus Saccharimonadaceae bacterium]
MTARRVAARFAITCLALAVGFAPAPARAQPSAPDTTLDRFLGGLSDSTDAYFGRAAVPADSTGLDSALAYGLGHPKELARRGRWRPDFGPTLGFNRVDGPLYGGEFGVGRSRALGRFDGRLRYAVGPNLWLGGGGWRRAWGREGRDWQLAVNGGRETATLNRTARQHGEPDDALGDLQALVGGVDSRRFLRRDGWSARLSRSASPLTVSAAWRDMLESPRDVTTGWSLTHAGLSVPDNLHAAFGRVHEATLDASVRFPRWPIFGEATYDVSRRVLGSAFEYRRTRAALGANFGLGRFAALVPEVAYGRLSGESVPQAAFYLGGPSTLGRFDGDSLGGTSLAIGRIDVIGAKDVLALVHLPHPAAFPLQLGGYAASGAVWGPDPYGGAARPGVDWPGRELWRSEVAASLIYQPGLPTPTTMLRLDVVRPVGPGPRETKLRLSVTRAMALLRTFGED